MALIICPECGKKISDKASSCIHCGYPICGKQGTKIESNVFQISSDEMENVENYPEFNCIINGTRRNVKWLIDVIREYNKEDLEKLKNLSQYYADFQYEMALKYEHILRKQDKRNPQKISDLNAHLAYLILETLDLSQEVANQFIVEILDNDILVPKVFNGLSQSEWSAKEIEKTKERLAKAVHCPSCGSTNLKRYRYAPLPIIAAKEYWRCNNCHTEFEIR